VAAGFLAALWDLYSGPSLELWALNSTVVAGLSVECAALLLLKGPKKKPDSSPESTSYVRTTPWRGMYNLLRGAEEGYTQNRKEIAIILRSAVAARVSSEAHGATTEEVDARILGAVGPKVYSEVFADEPSMEARVKRPGTYLPELTEGVHRLHEALGI
jgi:hypothetical protein